ncbi:MAG: hypothetical protein R8M45_09020 [Ghiorsea sp.]
MVSKGDNLTPPAPSASAPLHGEGMDRLFQMQKDLGKLEAQQDHIRDHFALNEKRFDKIDNRLDSIDVRLSNIDKKLYAAGVIITLVVIIVPLLIRIYLP